MISKELLSEVLKDKLKEEYNGSYDFICNGVVNLERNEVSSTLGFYDSELDFFINIYELAYKCKEWVLKQGYRIIIDCSKDIEVGIQILKNGRDIYSNENKSEQQSIFKACEWLLDNKED